MAFYRNGYIARFPQGSSGRGSKEKVYRNWWLVKYTSSGSGYITLNKWSTVCFPKEFVGKKVRLKVEVMVDDV